MTKAATTSLKHSSPKKKTEPYAPVPWLSISCFVLPRGTRYEQQEESKAEEEGLRTGHRKAGTVLLGYREDRTDRVCFRSTNAHLEAWKWINAVCPEANI